MNAMARSAEEGGRDKRGQGEAKLMSASRVCESASQRDCESARQLQSKGGLHSSVVRPLALVCIVLRGQDELANAFAFDGDEDARAAETIDFRAQGALDQDLLIQSSWGAGPHA